MFALGLIGGILADTDLRKRVLIWTQAAGLAATITMITLLATDLTEFWYAHLLMLIVGIGEALDMPTRRSLLHDFLGSRGVTNAVALDSVGNGASMIFGGAAAGALIAVLGVIGGHFAVAGLFMLSLMIISKLSIERVATASRSITSVIADLFDGIRYVAATPALMATVMITVIMNLLLFPYMHMVPVVAKDVLGVGPTLMGFLQAMTGLGSLIGSVLLASLSNVTHHGRLFIAGTMIAFSGLLMFSFSSSYILSMGFIFIIGLGLAGFISMQSLIAMIIARHDMRGKVLGVIVLAIGTGPLGALIVGVVAEQHGPGFALFINAAIGLPLVSLVALTIPQLRLRMLHDTAV